MEEFTSLGPVDSVSDGDMKAFEVEGINVAVANVNGTLHAFGNVCTHRQCPLVKGDLEGTTVTCPCHGSQFDVTSGAVLNGPAEESVPSYLVRIEDDAIQIAL